MKFKLIGTVWYDVGSCHDSRSVEINEEFEKPNIDTAIKEARKIVRNFHKKYSWHTDYGMSAELQTIKSQGNKTIIETLWKTRFVAEQPAEPARPAIPAKPAKSAILAHFKEEKLA